MTVRLRVRVRIEWHSSRMCSADVARPLAAWTYALRRRTASRAAAPPHRRVSARPRVRASA
eukprot:3349239-Prymnesium_polylepis.1